MEELRKDRFHAFINSLKARYEVIAPVREKGSLVLFKKIENPGEITLDYIHTEYPAKEYFLPSHETLMNFSGKRFRETIPKNERRVIFGLRPCDLSALVIMDDVFLKEPYVDPYYSVRRRNTVTIVLDCLESGPDCFCESVGGNELNEGTYDLIFTDKGEKFLVQAGSGTGKRFLRNWGNFFNKSKEAPPERHMKCMKRIPGEQLKKLENREGSFNHPVWEEEAGKCLSCATCNLLCPTCFCFDMEDEVKLDLRGGVRRRKWAFCQLRNFTRVAGEYVFRDERPKRLRHRIYHQLVYFKQRTGKQMCTGCGRCVTYCPTNIDMTEVVRKL